MADTIKIPGIGPVKKTWLYAGIGITAGILLLAYYRRSAGGGEAAAAAPATVDAGMTDYAMESDASGYNMVYPPSTGAYAQYGYDIYGNPLPAPTGLGGGTITTNSDWADEAAGMLTNAGVEQSVATTAITRVLGGLPVTSAQRDYFMQAVGTLGQPPQGYPTPIRLTDNGTEPKPTTPPAPTAPPAPTGLKAVPYREHVDLDWTPVDGVQGYTIWANGVRKTSNFFSTEHVWGLHANTAYKMEVAAFRVVDGKYLYGPKASVNVRTRK